MEEENKKTDGFHIVSEETQYDDDIIDELRDSDSLSRSKTKESVMKTKEGEEEVVKTTRTVTEEYVTVDLKNGLKAKHVNGKFIVQLSNGREMTVSDEEISKWFENGIGDGTYARVNGVREITVYEKIEVLKKKKKHAFLLLLLIPLLLSLLLGLGKCGKGLSSNSGKNSFSDSSPDIDPSPTPIINTDTGDTVIDNTDIINLLYNNQINQVLDVIEPGIIALMTRDAIDSTDYDMELMNKDFINGYGSIYDGVVKPSANYIKRLNEFKGCVNNSNGQSTETLFGEARLLLEEYKEMVITAQKLVEAHVKTTAECIEKGIRDDNYVYPYSPELVMIQNQLDNLDKRLSRIDSLTNSFEQTSIIITELKENRAKFDILKNGDVLLFYGDGTIELLKSSNTQIKHDDTIISGQIGNDTLDESGKTR